MQKRILVVDDDDMNLMRTKLILKEEYDGLEDDVRSAIKLGEVNYLKKPFLPHELMKRVAQELEKK